MKLKHAAAILVCALQAAPTLAMDSTEILPKGINSPAFRYVIVSGIDSKYSSDGSVRTLNDINTIHFDAEQLSKLDKDFKTLSTLLDQYSQQQLGSQLNLGTLRIETEPEVTYIAPIYARGITDRLTFAAAIPVVFYKNSLQMNQSSSNAAAICSQFNDFTAIPDIKEACDTLSKPISETVRGELAKFGYKPIQDRKETLIGDMQLLSFWKFQDSGDHSTLLRTTLTLPTGKKDDPDDLADLGAFGQTAVEPALIYNFLPHRKIRLAAKAGYKFMVPDSMVARVPETEGEVLLNADSKEKVSRKLGDTMTLGAAVNYAIWDSFVVAGGYEYNMKGRDSYSGSRGRRYDLLSADSKSQAHKLRGGLTYDTIGLYQRTKSFPPLKLDFEVINTFAGKNTDRQLVNELSLTMFF